MFLGQPKKGTFACLNCICCSSIIKGNTTIRAVKECVKEHRSNIRNFKSGTATDTTVSIHFHTERHNLSQLKWMILNKVNMPKGGGDIRQILSQREAYWIKTMDTMLPRGMNDHWSLIPFL
ncbi:hypothetical protein XELAEV_18005931mg [Xenopus laevis]|uniref:Uncharacterized protein n=1 Tax=Xenopus laevis TaxID=8355 RepID=A0A974I3B7_XENLA|nr:hypothetical protein XELAEV_18005931mg [Xenopus laevis]